MEHKVCYYCGTKYSVDEECCPLCGQTEVEPEKEEPISAAPVESVTPEEPKKKKASKSANTIATIICIVLAIAVVGGTVYILNTLGILPSIQPPASSTPLTLPVESTAVNCTGITVLPEELVFSAAEQKNLLKITREPADCTESITVAVGDPTIISVSETGEVTALAPGQTVITVTCGEFAKDIPVSCNFEAASVVPEVTPDEVTEPTTETTAPDESGSSEFSLTTDDFSLFSAGETATVAVKDAPAGSTVIWASANPAIAVVENGKVTAVGPGDTTISATINGETKKCYVRCKFSAAEQPAETVSTSSESGGRFLSHEDVTLVSSGETFQIRLIEDESRVGGVSWSTSDSSVCSVDANGNVTANGSGMAKISGTADGKTYTCIVRCNF